MVVRICCLKPNQPCAAGLDWLKVFYYVVLQLRQGPFETSEGLTHTYIMKNQSYLTMIWEKFKNKCPPQLSTSLESVPPILS